MIMLLGVGVTAWGADVTVFSYSVEAQQAVGTYDATGGTFESTKKAESSAAIKLDFDNTASKYVKLTITDGVKKGFDLEMLDAVCNAVSVPVIASGGAGKIEDFITLFRSIPRVDAGLAASIFHFGEVKINDLKLEMKKNGIPARIA